MQKTQHYLQGNWQDGEGEARMIHDSVTGEAFTSIAMGGLDIPAALQYGREKGDVLRKMTFQERQHCQEQI